MRIKELSDLSNLLLRKTLFVALVCASQFVKAYDLDDVQAIFEARCVSCHSDADPRDSLSLEDAMTSEAQLVDVDASCTGLANQKRVIPGEPENSVLYTKVNEANPACDGVMPPNGNMITAAERNTIYDWIISLGPAGQFGLIEMELTEIDSTEDDSIVSITVNRLFGSQGEVSVDFALTDGTAVSPDDYNTQAGTLIFAEGVTTQTIDIVLIDDELVEDIEVFFANLSNISGGAVFGSKQQTQVTVTDDDKPGTFLFSRVNYSVAENSNNFDVNILRAFGSSGEVTVELGSADATAIAPNDYTNVTETLVFAEGENSKAVTVSVLDDQVEEGDEVFSLILSNPTNGALLGAPNTVTVTISDDESQDDDGDDGDDGGDDAGGDDSGDTDPETEAEYTAAGSLMFLLPIFLLFVILRKINKSRIF
jgi:hypothetical protein